jgi:hypothetical protein
MKDFQCFPKQHSLSIKAPVVARKEGGIFRQRQISCYKISSPERQFQKRTRDIPKVALAYSVHAGEKIAHNKKRQRKKYLG